NAASDDWHTTAAAVDLRVGGTFSSRMEAKDGSFGFDFGGVYDDVNEHRDLSYTLGDGRKVKTTFEDKGGKTLVTTMFDPEQVNPVEMQQGGWQAILNNYVKYTESV
ncbi:MAG: SRPBCC domain-containing protein, partial [Chitinophagaceae bacterium]|nr:SRPBCC domain-containing protein [Chitinophagaceae bacterium]